MTNQYRSNLNAAIVVSGSNGSYSANALSFGSQGNVSFYTNNSNQVIASAAGGGGGQTGISGVIVSNTTYTSGTISYVNANGISFGSSGANGISASYTVPSTTGLLSAINVSGGTTSNNLSQIKFSNSNNVSFGLNASIITASASFNQTAQTGISGFQVSNTTYSSGTVIFNNANGISFGSSGANGISASYTVPTQSNQTLGLYAISQSTGGGSTQTVDARSISYAGYGIVSVGFSNGTVQISGPGTTNFNNMSISAGTTTGSMGSLVFSNSNNVSFGLNGSTITASVAGGGGGPNVTLGGNTTGTLALVSTGTLFLAGGNNITLSQNANSVTISAANAGGAQTGISGIIVSNTTYTSGTVSFVNANGLSFGSSGANGISGSYSLPAVSTISGTGAVSVSVTGSTISIGVPIASHGVSTGGNTAGATGTQSGQLVFVGGNNVTLSVATAAGGAQTITISGANAGGAQTGISGVIVSNTTYTSGTISYVNANGISFGSSGANGISASYTVPTQSTQPVAISGSNGSFTFSTLTFGNLNGISHYTSNGSLVASYNSTQFAGQGTTFAGANVSGSMTLNSNGLNLSLSGPNESGVGISANGSSQTAGNIVFSNSNGVSFGMNGSTITASVAGGAGGVALYDGANSISSGTARFSNANNISFGFNGQTITGSVPGLSTLSGLGGITISTAAGVISVSLLSGLPPLQTNFWAPYGNNNIAPGQIGQGSIIFDGQPLPAMQFDRVVIPIYNTNSSLSSGSHSLSMRVGIYSQNGSTLSLVGSNSVSTAVTHSGTLGSYSQYSGMRNISMGMTATLTSGNYWIAFGSSTSSAGADGSYSNIILNRAYFTDNLISGTLSFGGNFGAAVSSSAQYNPGQGYYSATSNGMPAAVAFSEIYGTNSNGFNPPALYFRSGTF